MQTLKVFKKQCQGLIALKHLRNSNANSKFLMNTLIFLETIFSIKPKNSTIRPQRLTFLVHVKLL